MSRMIALVTLAAAATALGSGTAHAAELPCTQLAKFAPANFPPIPNVDSRLLPLQPGWQRVYTGKSNVSGQSLSHQVIFTVTDLTKVIDGVRTIVVHDVDVSSGVVTEEELSFWAQDAAGNVWNVGEYPEEHLANGIIRAPSVWMAGTSGAIPGIHMPAAIPKVGSAFYLQGSVPKIGFLDCAQTAYLDTASCVPVGCFNGVMIADEDSPLDPGSGIQRKSYAPGVGIVAIGFIDDPQGEQLVLTRYSHLDEQDLAPIRDAALAEDVRGLTTHPDYARSPAVERLGAAAPTGSASAPPDVDVDQPLTAADRRIGRVTLVLSGASRHVGRAGVARVRMSCATPSGRPVVHPGRCTGAVDLLLRGRRVGTTRFSVRGGLARTLRVRLSPSALRALSAGRVFVVAHTRDARAGGRPAAAARTLTLTR